MQIEKENDGLMFGSVESEALRDFWMGLWSRQLGNTELGCKELIRLERDMNHLNNEDNEVMGMDVGMNREKRKGQRANATGTFASITGKRGQTSKYGISFTAGGNAEYKRSQKSKEYANLSEILYIQTLFLPPHNPMAIVERAGAIQ